MALGFPGVTLVQVVPRADGAGTVTVYLWGEDAAPSAETIAAVQAELDRLREVAVTVKVQAATKVTMNVPVNLKVAGEVDFQWAKEETEAAVRAYFDTLEIGQGYQVTDVSRAILNAVPAVKLEFPSIFQDMAGNAGMLFRPTTVTVEELE